MLAGSPGSAVEDVASVRKSQHKQECESNSQSQREVDHDEDTIGLSSANTIRVLRAKLKAQEQDIQALSQKLSVKERDVSKTDDSFKDLRDDLAKESRLRAQAQAAAEKFKKLLDEKVRQVFVTCRYCCCRC
jgi:predicted RNase H-like nuclease (RuvC/YqgF family)